MEPPVDLGCHRGPVLLQHEDFLELSVSQEVLSAYNQEGVHSITLGIQA